ncbi:MAG: hypothetical protein KAT86_08365, partial [Candidatus Latescibacteria bacterium]|nr:hypothetical protein [Candidatus Latescibacterota bacterium]
TGGTGLVVDGSIKDYQRVYELPINVFTRGLHPSGIGEVTLTEINGPVRIGKATVLPGDVVLGTPTGVLFIPPQHARQVVETSETIRLRDYFGKMRIREGVYTPGEVDSGWSEVMEADFEGWKKSVDLESLGLCDGSDQTGRPKRSEHCMRIAISTTKSEEGNQFMRQLG